MPFTYQFKPAHKEIKRYYEELALYATHEVAHEGATSTAFQNLLAATRKKAGWHLNCLPLPLGEGRGEGAPRIRGRQVRPDGTLRDEFNLHHCYSGAKDFSDKLDEEIRKKIALGYPLSNTIFEDTSTAVLYQNGKEVEPRFNCQLFRLDSRRAPPAPFIPIVDNRPDLVVVGTKKYNRETANVERFVNSRRNNVITL